MAHPPNWKKSTVDLIRVFDAGLKKDPWIIDGVTFPRKQGQRVDSHALLAAFKKVYPNEFRHINTVDELSVLFKEMFGNGIKQHN